MALDDLLEALLTREGRENLVLGTIAAASIVGLVVSRRIYPKPKRKLQRLHQSAYRLSFLH